MGSVHPFLRSAASGSSRRSLYRDPLVLLFLGVLVSLVFFLLQNSLVFWSVFCLFFRGFKGSHGVKNSWCFCPKDQRKGGQGRNGKFKWGCSEGGSRNSWAVLQTEVAIASEVSNCSQRGVEFEGGSLHDGYGGFDGSGEHLALLLLVLQNKNREATVTVLAVAAVMAVLVPPLNSTPLFRHLEVRVPLQ